MKRVILSEKLNIRIDSIAYIIILTWCLLPVFCSMYCFGMALKHSFPIELYLNGKNYSKHISNYLKWFRAFGSITFLMGFSFMALNVKSITPKKFTQNSLWFPFLLLLLGYSVISTFFSDDSFYALKGSGYKGDGLFSYFIYAGLVACAVAVNTEKYRRSIVRVFCAVLSYLSLLMVIKELTGNAFLHYCFPVRQTVVFNNSNHMAYLMCMACCLQAGLYLYDVKSAKWVRILYAVNFSFLVYALLLNDTFGSYLAVVAVLPAIYYVYWKTREKITWIDCIPLLAFILLSLLNLLGLLPGCSGLLRNFSVLGKDISNILKKRPEAKRAGSSRAIIWMDTLKRIRERPLFGFGPEGLYGKNAIYGNFTPHNEYLQIACYLGIPALVLYLAALISLAKHHIKHLEELNPLVLVVSGGTLAYLISAFFGNPVFNTAPYYWIFLGLTTATNENTVNLFPERYITFEPSNEQSKKRIRTYIISGVVVALCIVLFIPGILKRNVDSKAEMIAETNDLYFLKILRLMIEWR